MGWIMFFQNSYAEILTTSGSECESLFGDRRFKEVTELK